MYFQGLNLQRHLTFSTTLAKIKQIFTFNGRELATCGFKAKILRSICLLTKNEEPQ